jgi:putative transposase
VTTDDVAAALVASQRAGGDARLVPRYQAILWGMEGRSVAEIVALLRVSRATVERWGRRFNQAGLAGLRPGRSPGRPRRLTEAQRQALGAALRQPAHEVAGDGVPSARWWGRRIQDYVARTTGWRPGKSVVYEWLHDDYEYSRQRPRRQLTRADPAAQVAFMADLVGEKGGAGRGDGTSTAPGLR